MYCTIETQVAQKRCDDLLRQAAHYRLVKEAMQSKARKHHHFKRLSVWLGKRLVSWGEKLLGAIPPVNLQETDQPKVV